MKKAIFLLIGCIAFTASTIAQDTERHSQSTSLVGGRYEIIMSDKAAKYSFRIDKFRGDVYLLVNTDKGEIGWEKMHVEASLFDPNSSDSINYQLYMSGIASKYTFLMNVNTGTTWQLVEDTSNKKNSVYWWKRIYTTDE